VFSLSPLKILIVVVVALVVLGPDKLPEVAHKLGSFWRSLKEYQHKVETDLRSTMPDLPSTSEIARYARSPINLLNSLADKATSIDAAKASPGGDVDLVSETGTTNEEVTEEEPPLPMLRNEIRLPSLPFDPSSN
jgi:sec-independent protein translocase protein TatB